MVARVALAIWKFPLESVVQELQIPVAGKVVHVGQQDGVPTIWVMVDPSQQRQGRRFHIVGTGQTLPDSTAYRGTVQMPNGLVWHVMEGAP
jgi:hypothetical protein